MLQIGGKVIRKDRTYCTLDIPSSCTFLLFCFAVFCHDCWRHFELSSGRGGIKGKTEVVYKSFCITVVVNVSEQA